MDPRAREHAETLVDWSARIGAGDRVVVPVGEGANDLAVAVGRALGERGATPAFTYDSDEVERAYLLGAADAVEGASGEPAFDEPSHLLALYESADAVLALRGGRNAAEGSDVPGAVGAAYSRASQAVREARMATDWVSTVHPTRSLAQRAGMSYEAYRDFAYGAILRDWESLAAEMARLKDVLDEGEEVRIVAGDGEAGDRTDRAAATADGAATDLRMSIEARTAVNSAASVAYGSHNLPSGEVFTAPVVDSVEGAVVFDLPRTYEGRTLRDVRLRFEAGEVVDLSAAEGEAALADVLDTDEGARRLGELGVGMNRGIDRVTGNLLFDEKMAGTVHLALGRAYEDCLPEGETGNQSAVHLDLLVDMRRATDTESRSAGETRLEVDDEVIQRNGVFRWEEGFDE